MNEGTGFLKKALIGLLVIGALFLIVLGYERIWRINEGPFPQPRQIMVDGQGKSTVIPNIAQTSFSVVSEGLTPSQVQTDGNKKMNDVVNYLKTNGVEEKDIQTTGYYLNPKYYYPNNSSGYVSSGTIIGYTLTQTISVKIRDMAKAGELVSGVVSLGVNQTTGISFTVDDDKLKELKNEARVKAFSEARQKAESMARAAGVKLGDVVSFSENNYVPYMDTSSAYGRGGGGGAAAPAVQIEPGTQEISVSVNITYELK